jgi:hypothetical protein
MINNGCICGGTIAIVFSNKQQFAFGMVTSHDNNVSMDWWECPHHHALVNTVVLCLCFGVNGLCCGLCFCLHCAPKPTVRCLYPITVGGRPLVHRSGAFCDSWHRG